MVKRGTTTKRVRRWKPAPAPLIAAFDAAITGFAGIERKKMFGYPAAFVNGRLFTGLFQESMIIKLPETLRQELLALRGAAPFEPVPGRVMREFVVVPRTLVAAPATLRPWLRWSYTYVKSLAPKTSKKPERRPSSARKR
jgi:hypothetical protein